MPKNARDNESKLHVLLMQLDRLEDLKEELDELGLRTIEEIDLRIESISRDVEALEEDSHGPDNSATQT